MPRFPASTALLLALGTHPVIASGPTDADPAPSRPAESELKAEQQRGEAIREENRALQQRLAELERRNESLNQRRADQDRKLAELRERLEKLETARDD